MLQMVSHLYVALESYRPAELVNKNGRKWKLSEKYVILAHSPLALLMVRDGGVKFDTIYLSVNVPKNKN